MKPFQESFNQIKLEISSDQIKKSVLEMLQQSEKHSVRCLDLEPQITNTVVDWLNKNRQLVLEDLKKRTNEMNYEDDSPWASLYSAFVPILTEDRIESTESDLQKMTGSKKQYALDAWATHIYRIFVNKYFSEIS